MTAGNDGSAPDQDDERGGFAFGEDRWDRSDGKSPTGRRIAPVVGLLVVAGLLLVGGYLAVGALSGPGGDVLGATGGAGSSGAPNGSMGSPADAADDRTPTAGNDEAELTGTRTAADSMADRSSAATRSTTDEVAGARTATAATPRSVEPPTADRTTEATTERSATDESAAIDTTTATDTTEVTETTEATETPEATTTEPIAEADTTAETSESRSPSIEALSTDRRSEDGTTVLDIEWTITDPDDDVETTDVAVIENPSDDAEVIDQRTIDADGSATDGDITVDIEDANPDDAYEVRLTVEDDAGNTALAVTRNDADSDG